MPEKTAEELQIEKQKDEIEKAFIESLGKKPLTEAQQKTVAQMGTLLEKLGPCGTNPKVAAALRESFRSGLLSSANIAKLNRGE